MSLETSAGDGANQLKTLLSNKIFEPRHNWTADEIRSLYEMPLQKLMHQAMTIQQSLFPNNDMQLCTLLSVKTGGCKEDCAYCPQSAHYQTNVDAEGLLKKEDIISAASKAKQGGASRFCMGAAWRSPPKKGPAMENLLESIREVSAMGLEVCTTLGMVDEEQAVALKDAGVHAYNHNLDSSREYYKEVISTRTYDDRLQTLKNVRKAGMTVCCGGIVGMGESREDRLGLLSELATMNPQPESVPINLLVRVEGTPLEGESDFDWVELVRTIAVARILMPKSRVRMSAGREDMSEELQSMCYMAGANSIFVGEKLLTTPNPSQEKDLLLIDRLGMKPLKNGPQVETPSLH